MIDIPVTIVITTYHRPDRICRAVDSALAQTCDKEVFVVDDNGRDTDWQRQTAAQLAKYGDTITYLVNEENMGVSRARNRALALAQGRYITFLDDDDEIVPEKLEKQIRRMEELGDEYSCCYCAYIKYLSGGRIHHSHETLEGDALLPTLARVFYPGSGSNLLVRTDYMKDTGGYDPDLTRFEDYLVMVKLLKDHKLAYVDEELLIIHYEIREKNPTYESLVVDDEKYFAKVREYMDSLPEKEQQRILQTASLERWRYALPRHETKDALQNMKKNKVSAGLFLRYILYLADRLVRKRSYGFKPF